MLRCQQRKNSGDAVNQRRSADARTHPVSIGGESNCNGSETASQPAQGIHHSSGDAPLADRDDAPTPAPPASGGPARDAGREVQLLDRPWPEATSAALAALLLGRDTRPSVAAIRAERQRRLQESLNAMDPLDREVLVLRHFEELSNAEVARELHLQESAASKRYIRALHRLKEILASLPGGLEEFRP